MIPLVRDVRLRVHVLCSWMAITAGGVSYAPQTYATSETGLPGGADDFRLVEVSGGADFSGYEYTWTITNRHTSPLVYLALSGHHVDVFTVPEEWTFKRIASGMVAIAGQGAGIATGRDATFKMRVEPKGAKRGRGNMTVRFADGTQYIVRDVEVPQPETNAETYMPLLGLAMMLLVVILARRKRARRRSVPVSD